MEHGNGQSPPAAAAQPEPLTPFGTKIRMADGLEYIVPEISWNEVPKLQELVNACVADLNIMKDDVRQRFVDLAHFVLVRNYPHLTRDEVPAKLMSHRAARELLIAVSEINELRELLMA